MIRSSKCSIKFANTSKKSEICDFIDEYRNVCRFFVDLLWGYTNIPKFIPKKTTSKVETWLSARAIQSASKQASGIVRGVRKKQKDRVWRYNKLIEEGSLDDASRLLKIIEKTNTSKPNCNTVNPELDSRFIKIDDNNDTSFDMWITLSSIGQRKKIVFPIKKNNHFNKLDKSGVLKSGLRLGKTKVSFVFELQDVEKNTKGDNIGLDMGIINTFTLSSGISSRADKHGHNLESIQNKMSLKKYGSKGFKRCQEHRSNYINWSVNQLNLKDIKTLNIENLKNVRKGKRTSKYLNHWTYSEIKDKIEARCEENGVRLVLKSYAYSSQRCSQCGWTQKANRNGKLFICKKCSYTNDADINASINISLDLPKIPLAKLQDKASLKGFYFGQENIVPVGQKHKNINYM